ncbi:voltage-dependent anion channel [Cladorrhinum sp. PSN332]|nr:voltage-dependent anion channel [Cladorrhinum sp. PSN332]
MRLVRSSNPIWFSIPTSLAFLALTLRLLPSALAITFPGLVFISTVLFLISLVGFALTSVLFLARLLSPPHIRLRHRSLPLIERDSVELGFVQYWPAGFALSAVAFGSCAVAEGRVANARAWAIAVYACWWITAAWMAGTGFFILAVYMSHSPVLVRSKTSPGRALPLIAVLSGVTGGATVALVGGVMCLPGSGAAPAGFETGTGKIISDAMAAPVVMFSYCSLGALLLLAVMTYAVAMHELLLVTGWPPPELTSVMFHLVGPLGQCSAALLVLGEASGTGRFLGDLDPVQRKLKKISPSTAAALPGAPINVVSAFCGMLLFGTAVLWFVLALIALCYRMYRRELEWSSTWNGAVFPLGTLAISSLWLSFELQSAFFRILTCILLIICLVAFLVVSVFNARSAVRSRVFRP